VTTDHAISTFLDRSYSSPHAQMRLPLYAMMILSASRRLHSCLPEQQQSQLAEGISRLSNSTAQAAEILFK
jgi:hypothetical protein